MKIFNRLLKYLLHPMCLAGTFLVIWSFGITGCSTSLTKPSNDNANTNDNTNVCMSPADIEWVATSVAADAYVSDDDLLGYGEYPESPTASQGSACRIIVSPLTCQGETIHIVNTRVNYDNHANIDGSGNLRKAALIFGGDSILLSQFTSSGSSSESQTSALNGDKEVPESVTVISQYPLSTAPANANIGRQMCVSNARATFSIE